MKASAKGKIAEMVRRVVQSIQPVARRIKFWPVGWVKTGKKFRQMASHADVKAVVFIMASVKRLLVQPIHRQAIYFSPMFHRDLKKCESSEP